MPKPRSLSLGLRRSIQSVVQAGASRVTTLRVQAVGRQRGAHVVLDLPHRRAAAVGGRDHHLQLAVALVDLAQDAELADRHHRNLGVGDRLEHRPRRVATAFTTLRPGAGAPGPAFRPAGSPGARSAGLPCRAARSRRPAAGCSVASARASSTSPSQASRSERVSTPVPRDAACGFGGRRRPELLRVRHQVVQRRLRARHAIRRCRRPGAPASRAHGAGGSAFP